MSDPASVGHNETSRAYTIMGNSADCTHQHTDPRQVHTKGMIGGGWRVDGKGGPELILEVQTRPGSGDSLINARTRIVIDRAGRVVEVTTL